MGKDKNPFAMDAGRHDLKVMYIPGIRYASQKNLTYEWCGEVWEYARPTMIVRRLYVRHSLPRPPYYCGHDNAIHATKNRAYIDTCIYVHVYIEHGRSSASYCCNGSVG